MAFAQDLAEDLQMGDSLFLNKPDTQKQSHDGVSNDSLHFGVSSMRGWRVDQEDAHLTIPEFDENAHFFAVFDGHGGSEVSRGAAKTIGNLLKSLPAYKQGHYRDALIEAFVSFDRSPAANHSSGTTACCAFIKNNTLYVANAGDSRCVISKNGQAKDMSIDHNPTSPKEAARIENAGGTVTEDGRIDANLDHQINLSRALGDHDYKQNPDLPLTKQMVSPKPDVFPMTIDQSLEFMVVACDGIWTCLTSQEVVDFIRPRLMQHEKYPKISLIIEEVKIKILITSKKL
ncbi:hypothetical protein RvY_06657-2 [Ramazzottius varieornatus]|uniref:protein-serine/threonine phosphatase n=1 Tax=Ramazzottius varieornatus TaxID=947166 RepID=A0A1D1V4T3_RAMVA|nr:hypothetical protein RvY_06657-2 [Ramazzottius varieornatus]